MGILSVYFWGSLPGRFQRAFSRIYAGIYNKPFTKYLIQPYIKLHYSDPEYLYQFRPASGNSHYQNFQDFFIRVFKEPVSLQADTIWPCEGLLCEYGPVIEKPIIKVKGQKRNVRTIFGEGGSAIPNDYYFSNVFLHNTDYHRVHAPLSGRVTRVEHIPGNLVMLRPWLYPKDPSLPAMLNERVNIDITPENGKKWYLSIIGGPAVGSIVLSELLRLNTWIPAGQELATFLLGSTVCMASPNPVSGIRPGDRVEVGKPY